MKVISLPAIIEILKLYEKFYPQNYKLLETDYGMIENMAQTFYGNSDSLFRMILFDFCSLKNNDEINAILIKEDLKIEDSVIKEELPGGRNIFVPINAPDIVKDYLNESKESENYKCYRAAIVLMVAALEANLQLKYYGIKRKYYLGDFQPLLEEAKREKWIVIDKYNNLTIKEIKDHRNFIVHFNFNSSNSQTLTSSSYAESKIQTISFLIESALVTINK